MSTERFKNVTSFVINLLNNKNNYPAQSRGISSDFSRLGLRPRRLSIRRYSARFRRIIVNYLPPSNSGKMASRFASLASEEIIQN